MWLYVINHPPKEIACVLFMTLIVFPFFVNWTKILQMQRSLGLYSPSPAYFTNEEPREEG